MRTLALLAALMMMAGGAGAGTERPAGRRLIYLHGRIVQAQQSARPHHETFGHYELAQIVDQFRKRGFVVTSELRPKDQSVEQAADRVAAQVRQWIADGVRPRDIVIVGASMGASIAYETSARLRRSDVRFVVIGSCLASRYESMRAAGTPMQGNFLAIREQSDQYTAECADWKTFAQPSFAARELVVRTGLDHGFLYRPHPDWFEPAIEFARGKVEWRSRAR